MQNCLASKNPGEIRKELHLVLPETLIPPLLLFGIQENIYPKCVLS